MSDGEEKRKAPRFATPDLVRANVCLSPYPPLFGEFGEAFILDLSAGGLCLQMKELVPKNVFLKLVATLPDQTTLESMVKVRHASKAGTAFSHGMEFLNPAPEMVVRIQKMASDFFSCENRIQKGANPVCRIGCQFFGLCRKSQKGQIAADSFSPTDMVSGEEEAQVFELEEPDVSDQTKELFQRFRDQYDKAA